MDFLVAAFGNWRVRKREDRSGYYLTFAHYMGGCKVAEDTLETFGPGYEGQRLAVAALKARGFN